MSSSSFSFPLSKNLSKCVGGEKDVQQKSDSDILRSSMKRIGLELYRETRVI